MFPGEFLVEGFEFRESAGRALGIQARFPEHPLVPVEGDNGRGGREGPQVAAIAAEFPENRVVVLLPQASLPGQPVQGQERVVFREGGEV